MIVDKDTHPERKIYYFGAMVIDQLRELDSGTFDYFDLYEKTKIVSDISIEIFSLTLDWLFMIGIIDSIDGKIRKCF